MDILERESCLHRLDTALHDAAGGAGRVVFVSGEAGIGKTTLVEQFVRRHRGGMRVLWGACDALFTPRPLGPLHDIAAHVHGTVATLLSSGSDRSAIFSAVLDELREHPAIVVFEDVHWADDATLDLIRFLGRRVTHTRAVLVLTYRDDELGPRHPLRSVVGDLAALPAARRIALPPLSPQAVRTLVGDRAINVDDLHLQTGGNPFFVTEVLAAGGDQIPATIREAVLARAARLSAPALAALQAAAVVGPRIEPWLLEEIADAEPQAVDECIVSGMLLAHGDMLAFRHELARHTLLTSISPLHKMRLHRLILEALRAAAATRDDVARLAHHAEGARDHQAVLVYAPAAARRAAAASAHREAAALYALAIRFADDVPPHERAALLEAYSWECNLIDQRGEGIAARHRAIDLWQASGNLVKQGENMARLIPMLRGMGQNADAEQYSRAAIDLLEPLPATAELALAYRMQAVLRLANRDNHAAIEWGQKAIDLADRCGDDDVGAMTHVAVGAALLFLDYDRGCSYLEQRLAVAIAADRETHAANALLYLGACSVEQHRFQQAQRYLAQGIAYTTEHEIDTIRLHMLAWQSLSQVYLGLWNEVAHSAAHLLQRPQSSVVNRIPALVALGKLHARRGHPQAQRMLDEALSLAVATGTLPHLGLVHAARAEAAWLAGAPARTIDEACAVYDLAVSKRHPWFTGELAFWRWRAGDRVDLPEWAAAPFARHMSGDVRAAAAAWQQLGCPYEQARALADGDIEDQSIALGMFKQLGALPAAEDLHRRMRSAGAPRIPRGPRPSTRENPFGLTARQMDILSLLGDGLSNTEIAARLYISPKTVDHHVSAVLARLEVPSRKAAAAMIRQYSLPHPI